MGESLVINPSTGECRETRRLRCRAGLRSPLTRLLGSAWEGEITRVGPRPPLSGLCTQPVVPPRPVPAALPGMRGSVGG